MNVWFEISASDYLRKQQNSKKSAKVIDLIWPQLTSVDLRRTGWPVESLSYYLGLHVHIHITSKNGDACKLCATEHIFRLTWPQLWRHRSKVRGSGSWNFQEGREKGFGKLNKNWWHSTGKQKRYSWKTAGGCIHPPPPVPAKVKFIYQSLRLMTSNTMFFSAKL